MASDTNNNLNFPDELLVEIFIRSPVKSLICAKCVCKLWYALIEDTSFSLNHFQYQKSHNKGRFLLQFKDALKYNYMLFDDETLVRDTFHEIDQFKYDNFYVHIEGPVNGLYCLYNGTDDVILWNPALMHCKTLPFPYPHLLPHVKPFLGTIGFGIDPLTHDYKLILIRSFSDRIQNEYLPDRYATVYNLNTNSWRLLDCQFEYSFTDSLNSTFVNGTYYWWQEPDESDESGEVIGFDMGKELFREIPGPDIPNLMDFMCYLTLYNDQVSLLVSKELLIDIWVMLEEGVWIKQFSITHPPTSFWPIGFWKNDGLLCAYGSETFDYNENSQTVLYNFNTQEFREVGLIGKGFQASVYYESLVPVDGGTHASLNTLSDFLRHFDDFYNDDGP